MSPYKDPEKRLAYQRDYEARMRADTGPRGAAWRANRAAWHRKHYKTGAVRRTPAEVAQALNALARERAAEVIRGRQARA